MNFEQLIQAMCQQAGIDLATAWQQHESGAQSAVFIVDGHLYSLFHAPGDGRQVIVRGDIGPLPEKDHHTALLELLQLNVVLYGEGAATFGADPAANRIIVLASLPLEAITPESVLRYLDSLAGISARWSKGYLFSTEPQEALADPRIEALKTSLQDSMERAPLS
jgi:hypothetical protein